MLILCFVHVSSTVLIEPSFVFMMGSIMLPPVQDTQKILAMDLGWRWPFRQKKSIAAMTGMRLARTVGSYRRRQTTIALSH